MGSVHLFLVDRDGRALPKEVRLAVESAYSWAKGDFPNLDPSLVSGWAEQVGAAMAAKQSEIESPRRYAFAALHGKIREHFRARGAREVQAGVGADLEVWTELDRETAIQIDRKVLFEELRSLLSERDGHILVLLQQGVTSPASIATALGISYGAAGKAIQRVKERVRAILAGEALSQRHPNDESD